jgi:hypothetical protein
VPLVAAAQTCCGCAIAGDIDEHVLRQAAANGRHLHTAHAHAARDGAPYLALGDLASISERRGLAPPETTPPPKLGNTMPETTPPPPATALPAPLSAAELAWHAANRPIRRRTGTAQAGGVLPCIWSAHQIGLRHACVDVLIVDLPFGITHKVRGGGGGLRHLYHTAMHEGARVLRPAGRLVALAVSRKTMAPPFEDPLHAPLWASVTWRHVNCGGSFSWVVHAVRSSVPYASVRQQLHPPPPPPRPGGQPLYLRGLPASSQPTQPSQPSASSLPASSQPTQPASAQPASAAHALETERQTKTMETERQRREKLPAPRIGKAEQQRRAVSHIPEARKELDAAPPASRPTAAPAEPPKPTSPVTSLGAHSHSHSQSPVTSLGAHSHSHSQSPVTSLGAHRTEKAERRVARRAAAREQTKSTATRSTPCWAPPLERAPCWAPPLETAPPLERLPSHDDGLPFFLLSLLPRWCTAGPLSLCGMRDALCLRLCMCPCE